MALSVDVLFTPRDDLRVDTVVVMRAPTTDDAIRGQILHLMVTLSDKSSTSSIGLSKLLADLQQTYPEVTETVLGQHLELLEDRGLVRTQRNGGGVVWILELNSEGRELAAAFVHDRNDPVKRVRQLQDDYLRWVYLEIEYENHSPAPEAFLATSPTFLGVPYTAKELEKAGSRLRDNAYISGEGAWQHAAPLRPQLTAKGRHTVEENRSVHDALPQQASVIAHVNGYANLTVGDYATQTLTVNNDWPEALTKFLDAVSEAAATMPADVRAALDPQLDEAREAVASREPSKVKKTVGAIGTFLSAATSGALGNVLAQQIPLLLAVLP